MNTLPSIIDIAKLAGVSKTTVSKVMNNQYGVSEDTRKKVLDAAERLQYTPNLAARSLVTSKTNVIGVVYDSFSSPVYTELAGLLEHYAKAQGYHLVLSSCNNNLETKANYIQYFMGGAADGVILFGSALEDRQIIEKLMNGRYPFTVIENRFEQLDINNIVIRNSEGAAEAVRHLAGLGHTRIAHITGNMQHRVALDRMNGYISAMQDLGLGLDPRHIIYTDAKIGCGAAAADQLLALEDRPTAVFAFNDIIAYEIMDAFHLKGIRVPDDFSLIGFDNIREWMSFKPGYSELSSIAQPLKQMAAAAVELTVKRVNHPDSMPETVMFSPKLVLGGSCRSII
jgi:DNA-binding LacI/PurR family transcriptional regulator